MTGVLLRRVGAAVPVMLTVAIIVFLLLRLTPGDPAAVMAGDNASTADITQIRRGLGLDRPIVEQFLRWIGQVLRGDLGQSFFFKMPVTALIAQRAGPTLALATATMLVVVLVAVPLGVLAAYRYGGLVDRLVMGFAVLGFSVPVFVLGYLLIYVFAIRLDWLPVQGYRPPEAGLWQFAQRLILPACALSVVYIALVARITRAAVLATLAEDYIRTARAKGLAERAVLLRHALRNAALPIVTVLGLSVALLVGGVVVTESVFNIPGLGRLTVDAVLGRDFPTIQGVVLLFSAVYVLVNLLVDIACVLLDPRIRR